MTFCLPTPPFFGPVSSILSLKSNIGSGLVFGGQVTPRLVFCIDRPIMKAILAPLVHPQYPPRARIRR
jgi:hypothetical protein